MRAAVIINGASRSGRSHELQKKVTSWAESEGATVVRTERRGHATELARGFADQGSDRVIAVGGDGTLSEVANGLAGSATALAAVPTGTGNDWVRSVGVPTDPGRAWRIAMEGRVAETDLAEVEGYGYSLNVLGAGFDAEVARSIANASGLLARLGPTPRYVASVLKTVVGYPRTELTLSIDGGEPLVVPQTLLVAVGVAKFYGSGMKVLPNAILDDGELDVVWGSGIRSWQLPGLLARVYRGVHLGTRGVQDLRCREVVLSADSPTPFHIDGDVRGELPITVRIAPMALKIVVPN